MQRKEFRYVLPLSLDEYRLAEAWCSTQEYTKDTEKEGIRLVEKRSFNDAWGCGTFYHSVYSYPSVIPGLVKTLLNKFYPNRSLNIHEKTWNSFPRSHSKYTNEDFLKNILTFNIDTMVLPDLGTTENALELPQSQWENVVVQVMDIAQMSSKTDARFSGYNPLNFVSRKTGRGPLGSTWIKDFDKPRTKQTASYQPTSCVCAYKLITCEFQYWGLQKLVQDSIISHDAANILGFHQKLYCSMDEWIDLSMDDIDRITLEKL